MRVAIYFLIISMHLRKFGSDFFTNVRNLIENLGIFQIFAILAALRHEFLGSELEFSQFRAKNDLIGRKSAGEMALSSESSAPQWEMLRCELR